jgi:gas vesicle protein
MRTTLPIDSTLADGAASFGLGLICGVALGAAIGLLLAPKAGSALRGDLAATGKRLGRKAADFYQEASGKVADLAARGREAVDLGEEALSQLRSPGSSRTQG